MIDLSVDRHHAMLRTREYLAQGKLARESYHDLLNSADQCCDWAGCLHVLSRINQSPPGAVPTYQALMGDYDEARRSLAVSLLESPLDGRLLDLYQATEARAADTVRLVGPEISLVPLQPEHLEAFFWQYNDRIRYLVDLPWFPSDDSWLAWLEEHDAQAGNNLFAIVHHEWGLIGSAAVDCPCDQGFIHYWLGEAYQGQGLGSKAVAMLVNHAFSGLGVSGCYAKVYESNQPSIGTLRKLGFEYLPVTFVQPEADQQMYYLGQWRSRNQHIDQVRNYLFTIGAATRVCSPYLH